jgi:hypothetical protein
MIGDSFLTTPHLGINETDTGAKLGTILRKYSRQAGQRAIVKESVNAHQLCYLHFEELGLKVPVLYTFETEESRFCRGC